LTAEVDPWKSGLRKRVPDRATFCSSVPEVDCRLEAAAELRALVEEAEARLVPVVGVEGQRAPVAVVGVHSAEAGVEVPADEVAVAVQTDEEVPEAVEVVVGHVTSVVVVQHISHLHLMTQQPDAAVSAEPRAAWAEVDDSAVEAADFAGVEALPSALEDVHLATRSERGRSLHHARRSCCASGEEQGATAVDRGACRLTGGWVLAVVEEVVMRASPEVATGGHRVMSLVSESKMSRQQE
jgi:hypothetical protein